MVRPLLAAALALAGCNESNLNSRVVSDDPDACLDAPPRYDVSTAPDCAADPILGGFEPVLGWAWTDNASHTGFHQIMATPAVGHLDDDDGDGVIGQGDVPDVVFTAFAAAGYRNPGVLVALDGATGVQRWSLAQIGDARPYGSAGVAIADLGDGRPVVLVPSDRGLIAVNGDDGTLRWTAPTTVGPYGHPAVADVDGDGDAEIVLGDQLVDSDGTLLWTGGAGTGGGGVRLSFAVDLDGDGIGEVIAGNTVYEADGSVRWTEGDDGYPAVGDLDLDGVPEIITVAGEAVVVRDVDGALVWRTPLSDGGGGPPTVADFDGDGRPEIGVASRSVYRVVDDDGAVLWSHPVQDFSSSRTGSSVFDFEGDGAAEVVYADEETLWIWDGATGEIELQWEGHSSGTLFEYPLVVDVDSDGAAEIVLASNDYSPHSDRRGILILEDADETWAAARPVWNQHAWSIANIDDDGVVPPGAPGNWGAWNSFRAGNSETAVGLGLPDLTLPDPRWCDLRCESAGTQSLWIPVENRGSGAAGGAWVSVVAPDGERLELLRLDGLDAGAMTWLGPVELTAEQAVDLTVHVDDDGEVEECDEDDNTRPVPPAPCD